MGGQVCAPARHRQVDVPLKVLNKRVDQEARAIGEKIKKKLHEKAQAKKLAFIVPALRRRTN